MNPPTHSEAQHRTLGRWERLAWLPIPLLLAAIIAARMAGLRDIYESHMLLLVLSFTFYTLVSLGTLYLIGRSFLALGSPGLLLLECGVVFWSLAGTVGDFVSHGDANINVSIFNIGILLAGLCHLAGTILALRPQRVLRAKPLWLGAGFVFALGALWLVSHAALMGWLPVFFIPGHGGTPMRYIVLGSAITLFVLSASLLKANQRMAHLPFTSWYALALLMLAVGLFGVMIQLSLGCVVNWLSRTAQWLGGVYLLFAAVASLRESQLPLLPQQSESSPAYYRDAVAVAMVLAAAAIRLAFLSTMGMQAPFVTFYPAVIFASLYGGLRAGLLATALSAIVVDYFWIEPVGQFAIEHSSDWLAMLTFLLTGALITGVSDAMHRARTSASAAEKQALLATERAAAAEALHETRAKLEAALESMSDAVFISDTDGNFIDFNEAFATFHKFRNKDECAKTFAEYPDILDVFMADGTLAPLDMWAVPRALRGETATNVEYALRRKDTGQTWVGSYSFGPIRDKGGIIVGSVVVGRDITDHKRAEDALHRQSEMLEHAPVLVRNLNDEIILWNSGMENMYGYWRGEALGKVSHDLLQTVHPQPPAEIISQIRNEGQWEGELHHKRKDGKNIIVTSLQMLHRDPDGNAAAIIEVNTDITMRKQAEDALRKAKDEMEERVSERTAELQTASLYARSLIEASLDPLVTISADGKITDVNRASEEITGVNRLQLIGSDFSEYFTEPEKARAGYKKVFQEGSVRDYPLEIKRREGHVTPVLYNASLYRDKTGQIMGVFAAARDITKRKQAEEALEKAYGELEQRVEERTFELKKRTAQLEEANKELESFAYSVSHDLRAPLRAIDGYARMLLKKHGQAFDEDSMRKFNVIRSSSQTMGQLIDDILTLSRLGRAKMSIVNLDMEGIIKDVWKELQTIDPERNMALTIRPMPSGYGDRTLIKQVYANLLGNAVKFTKYKNPAEIEVGGYEDGDDHVYYVKDNGVGFDMAYYDKLFGIFQRLHNNPDFEGTGVGLATIQRAVHRHGGRVWAEGKVDEGATFYFSLPLSLTHIR
ncbi:MAG: PAS domain S-box protein [Syntrophales bacterium]